MERAQEREVLRETLGETPMMEGKDLDDYGVDDHVLLFKKSLQVAWDGAKLLREDGGK